MTLSRIAFLLLWLFVFTVPMTYTTAIPMIGILSSAIGFAATVAGALAIAARGKVRLMGPAQMAMAGFILWTAVTLCWSMSPDLTIQRVMTHLQLFVLVLLVWETCVEEKDILRILGALVLGTIIPALWTLYGFLPGQVERAAVPGYDANQLAFLLALSLPAAYFLILRKKGFMAWLYRLQMGFAVCAILLSGSANSIIAMAVGLSLVCWTFRTISVRSVINGLVIVTLIGGIAVQQIPASLWKSVAEQTRKSNITLTNILDREMEILYPTPAGGFGGGTQARPAVAVSYSLGGRPTSFTVFAETGVVGVACFLAMIGMLALATERMTLVDKSFWLTSLAVWIIGAFSLSWDCSQPTWLMFGLLAAHSACLSAERTAKAGRRQLWSNYFEDVAEVYS